TGWVPQECGVAHPGTAEADDDLIALPIITDGADQLHRGADRRSGHGHPSSKAMEATRIVRALRRGGDRRRGACRGGDRRGGEGWSAKDDDHIAQGTGATALGSESRRRAPRYHPPVPEQDGTHFLADATPG
ncbi:MAG: hypothetical protein WKF38_03660, partial [Candidatus Limnocylindrales bacterium]